MILVPGTRRATAADARAAFDAVWEIVEGYDYHVALNGSAYRDGEGNDVDLIVARGSDATWTAIEIANLIVKQRSVRIHHFEVYENDGSVVGFAIAQRDGTLLDVSVHGLPDREGGE